MGLLLLSVVVSSQPEAFHAHQQELLQLLNETLSDVSFPGVLFYSLRTLTAMARYVRPDDVVRRWLSPPVIPVHLVLCPRFQKFWPKLLESSS